MLVSSRSFLAPIAILFSCSPLFAALVLNDLGEYTNDFNFLAGVGKGHAWTNDQSNESSSGSPGWYWQNETASLVYEAGGAGDSGAFSFGTPGDRAMGNYADAGNPNTAWGVVFQNKTGQTISQLDISYKGEQWRRAGTSPDRLHFSFISTAMEITDLVAAAGASPTDWSPEVSLAFTAPLAPGTPAFFDPIPPTPVSSTISITVPHDHYFALRWYDGDVLGDDAALGIDDLTVSFTATAVPEPTAFLFGGLVCGVYLVAGLRKRRVDRGR